MIESRWEGYNFKKHCHGNAKTIILKLAYMLERIAKENITISIYNRPQRGTYKRTGAARSSIQTEYNERGVYALIGSDENSLRQAAMTRYSQVSHFKRQSKGTQRQLRSLASTATGSTVFYFGWLEDGFHTRKGEFIEGHHMLKRALDTIKRGLR